MRRWTLTVAAFALVAAVLWHLPATAQRAAAAENADPAVGQTVAVQTAVEPAPARPIAPQLISFEEYRDFRLHDIAQRQARLTRELAELGLTAAEKATLQSRKAYYDRLAAMPSDQRARLFRARFDQIDTNRDGLIDDAERTAWREKQREHYHELAAARTKADAEPR